MNKAVLALLCAGTLGSLHAAPGLVVDGTQFKYNGERIFFSGMNLAWIDYNSDVASSPLNENAWRAAVEGVRKAGGNSIRWWLFNNMSTSPLVGADNLVSGLPSYAITNMKKALDIAEEYGVMVSMCLFSHNLMEPCQWGSYEGGVQTSTTKTTCKTTYDSFVNIEANKKLFTDAGIEAFIDNALKPVLEKVGNHNALMTWELFNEPEGMASGATGAWTPQTTPIADMQKFANRVTAAIKDHDDALLVSNGIHNAGAFSYWTDSALVAAGGENKGVLDFYQVHFYPEHQGSAQNPFEHPASHWQVNGKGLGKPIVIGEFSAGGWDKSKYPAYKVPSMTAEAAFNYAYENGYAGALAWDINGFNDIVAKTAVTHNLAAATPGLESLYLQYEDHIKIKDYTPAATEGNGVMQVTYSNVSSTDGATLEYTNPQANLTGNPVITFNARTIGSSGAMSVRLITKSGDWKWVDNQEFCEIPAGGKWITCSFDLVNDYSEVTVSNVRSFLIQTYTEDYSGTIQIDNFKAGSLNIVDFDTQYDLFGIAASMAGAESISEIKTVYTTPSSLWKNKSVAALQMRYLAGSLYLNLPATSQIHVVDVRGNPILSARLEAGTQQVVLGNLSAGVYHAQVRNGSSLLRGSFVVR